MNQLQNIWRYKKAEASLGIATIAILFITIVGAMVLYQYYENVDDFLSKERLPPSAVLIENAYFVKVGNTTHLVLFIRGLMGNAMLDTVYIVNEEGTLETVGTLLNPRELTQGEVEKLVYSLQDTPKEGHYKILLGHGSGRNTAGGDTVLIGYKPSISYDIYLVNIPGIRSHFISDPVQLKDALEQIGNTYIIDTTSQLEAIIDTAGPHTVIINLHGEALPTPTPYWAGAGYQNTTYLNGTDIEWIEWGEWEWKGATPDWRTWLTKIRNAVTVQGATWIEAGGWAFYYLANESSTVTWGSTTGTLGWYKVAQCDYGDCTMGGSGAGLGLHYILTHQEAYVTPDNTSAFCYSPLPKTLEATPELEALSQAVEKIIGTPPPTIYTTNPDEDRPCLINQTQVDPRTLIPLHKDTEASSYLGVYLVRLGKGFLGHVGYGTTITEQERAALITALVLKAIVEEQ